MDIETLGLSVDSRPVVKAANDLDRLAAAGARAESTTKKATDGISSGLRQTGASATAAADSHVAAYRSQQQAGERYLQTLRDEIATLGKSRASVEAYRAAQAGLTAEQQKSAAAMGRQIDAMKSQEAGLNGLRGAAVTAAGAMGALFAVKQVHDFTRALFDASAQAQRIQTTLNFASGGNGAAEYDYIRKIAKELGLELTSTAEAYGKFAAASRGTALEGEGARKVFESVAKASAVMGLSAENTSGVLLALQQMISKGSVQSEELRGQLGERLPGAFQTAARAMGVTTAELGKMLEQGLVPAAEFLPKFADQMTKELGDNVSKAVNRLDASVNRFNTSWGELKRSLGDSGIARGYANTLDAASGGIDSLWQSVDRMSKSKSFGEWVESAIWSSENLRKEIDIARGNLDKARADLERAPKNIYFSNAAQDAQEYLDKLEAILARQRRLSGVVDVEQATLGEVLPAGTLKARYQEQQKLEQQERDAYYAKDVRQTKAQIREENITKAILANSVLVQKARGNEAELTKLRAALEVEIANIIEKTTDKKNGAAAVERDSINATIEAYKREQAVVDEVSRRKVAALAAQRAAGDLSEVEYLRAVAEEELKRMESAEKALQAEIRAAQARKNGRSQVAALEGQLDLQREKRMTRQQELQNDLIDLDRKREEAARNLYNADASRSAQEVQALRDTNKLTEKEIEMIGLTDKQKRKLVDTRMRNVEAMQAERIEIMRQFSDGSSESAATIDAEIAKLEELRKARRLANERNSREESAATAQYYRDAWASVESSAHEAWLSIGDDGVNSSERVGKALKTAVLDMLWQITAKKWFIDIAANVSGGGSGSSGMFGGGDLGSAANLISNGFNIAGMGGMGMQRLADIAYNYGLDTVGELVDQFRYGMMDTASWSGFQEAFEVGGTRLAGAIAGSVMNGFAGYGISRTLSGGYSAGNWVNTAAGIASAIPGVGPIAGVVGAAVNRLFGRKLKDSGIEGTFGGDTGFEGQQFEYYKGGLFRSNKTKYSALDEDLRKALGDQFNSMRVSTAAMAEVLGLGSDSIKDFTSTFRLSLKDLSTEEAQKKLQEELDKVAESLASSVLGTDKYGQLGETAVESLTRLSTSLVTVNKAFDSLGTTLYESSLDGADMASSLVALFGSLDNFTSSTSGYYQNFYSEEERRAKLLEQLTKQFTDQNLALPKTRDAYRDMVDSLDLTTEEGRKTYAMLVNMSGVFATLFDNGEKARAAIEARQDLENRILKESGQDVELLARQRWKEREALRATYPEFEYLLDELYALEDANAATAKELEKTNKRQELENRLLQLQGEDSELLARQRWKEREALRATYPEFEKFLDQIYAIEDAQRESARVSKVRADAMRNLTDATAREQERISAQRDIVNESLQMITNVFELVRDNARDLYGEVEATASVQAARGWAFIEKALSTARYTGYLPDAEALQQAIGSARGGMVESNYSTQFDFDRDRLVLAGQLSDLEKISGQQKTTAELQLELLEQQSRQLSDQLKMYQRQIDIANGTYNATITVAQAVRELTLAITGKDPGEQTFNNGGSSWGGGSGAAGPTQGATKYSRLQFLGTGIAYEPIREESMIARLDKLFPVYHSFDGTADLAGLREAFKAAGGTISDLSILSGYWEADWRKAYEAIGIPEFRVGTNYVPQDMLAVIHEGEAVVPKQYNPAAGGGDSSGSAAAAQWIATVQDEFRRFFGEQLRMELRAVRVLEEFQVNGVPVYPRNS